jgi:hypothetical protein
MTKKTLSMEYIFFQATEIPKKEQRSNHEYESH